MTFLITALMATAGLFALGGARRNWRAARELARNPDVLAGQRETFARLAPRVIAGQMYVTIAVFASAVTVNWNIDRVVAFIRTEPDQSLVTITCVALASVVGIFALGVFTPSALLAIARLWNSAADVTSRGINRAAGRFAATRADGS